jgi:hypothetical protein
VRQRQPRLSPGGQRTGSSDVSHLPPKLRSFSRITPSIEASGLCPLVVGLPLAAHAARRADGIEAALGNGEPVALITIAGLLIGSLSVAWGQFRFASPR